MLEYSTLLNADFGTMISSGYQKFMDWVTGIPFYWHIAALILFLLLIKLLTYRKS